MQACRANAFLSLIHIFAIPKHSNGHPPTHLHTTMHAAYNDGLHVISHLEGERIFLPYRLPIPIPIALFPAFSLHAERYYTHVSTAYGIDRVWLINAEFVVRLCMSSDALSVSSERLLGQK
eukprot:415414-Prorocentrum_minimum.AAC.5